MGNANVIGGYPAAAPGRIGFQIGDEPVIMAELNAILAGASAVRAADPTALVIVNFTVTRADDIDAQLALAGAPGRRRALLRPVLLQPKRVRGAGAAQAGFCTRWARRTRWF